MRPSDELLAAYLEKEVTPSDRQSIELFLQESSEARRRLTRIGQLTTFLREPVGEDTINLLPSIRKQLSQKPTRRPSRWIAPVGAFAAAAMLLLVIVGERRSNAPSEQFRAKSAAGSHTQNEWSGIQAYAVENQIPTRMTATLRKNAGLLFSYTNLQKSPFSYLMVFAVNDKGNIYWFYPAYQNSQTNPQSIPIEHASTPVELNDVVQHDYTIGPLTIYGLFSVNPLTVSRVEQQISQLVAQGKWSADTPIQLVLPQVGHHILQTRIVPE